MCIIVDANTTAEFVTSPSAEAKAIFEWVQRSGRIAVGGRLTAELLETRFRQILLQFDRSGRVLKCEDGAVKQAESKLKKQHQLRSDDPHVIAVALTSGARLLFSRDRDLCRDFVDKEIVRPKGSIYKYADRHGHLLRRAVCRNC